jgi:hypothetical protein
MNKKIRREQENIFSLAEKLFEVMDEQQDLFFFERPFLTNTPGESFILPYLEKEKELAIKYGVLHLELISSLNEYGWRTV